jgi:hypothetical protein
MAESQNIPLLQMGGDLLPEDVHDLNNLAPALPVGACLDNSHLTLDSVGSSSLTQMTLTCQEK